MNFLQIIAVLGVAIVACDAWTVDEVKDKINSIQDISKIVFPLSGHKEWHITYSPESGDLVPGTLVLDNVRLTNIADIQVNGTIIQHSDNLFEIPMQANYKYDLDYNITITDLMQNEGKALGEINEFRPVVLVRITDGVFEYVEVISLTLGSVPITFTHSKYSKAHDVIFNELQPTLRSLIINEFRILYSPLVSAVILSFVNRSS